MDDIQHNKERIWKIRDYIQELEDIKEGIIHFLNSRKKLDEVTKNLWISDVKDFYYNTVAAWEMLSSASKGSIKDLENSKNFLHLARGRLSKSISELKYYEEDLVDNLVKEVEISFEKCWGAFHFEFKRLAPRMKIIKPIARIVKVSDSEYHLPCLVCGKISVKYNIGFGRFDDLESLVYTGITHSRSLRRDLANELFVNMKNENILGIHQFMQKYHSPEGLDAYCPQCDKIYCWEHYEAREEYDDGFYDCTYGTCPNGHRRMIDD
ncbi:MAG: hypothetical protein KGD67_02040 [Candidatus Lokiarchaeota archaeon]|nr:hypothetical protein [Candidatus Lokiarchaeota archaeon]